MPDDFLSIMTKEVVKKMREANVPFRTAFMNAAHKRDIYHHKNANQYNYFFAQIIKRVKRIAGFDPKNQTLPLEETASRKMIAENVPRAIVDYKQLAAHDLFN